MKRVIAETNFFFDIFYTRISDVRYLGNNVTEVFATAHRLRDQDFLLILFTASSVKIATKLIG